MSAIFTVLLFVIFLAVVASLYTEGMWGNALRLIDVTTSALVATSFFEPVANQLQAINDWTESCKYVWDFLAIWLLFVVSMIVLRGITDLVCRVKVRFLKIADQIGSIVFSCLVALVMVCFVTFSLHTAPLAKNFMWGGFDSQANMMAGLGPDRIWITFVRSLSRGPLACSPPNVFDPHDQFRTTYEQRREEIEKHVESTGELRTR